MCMQIDAAFSKKKTNNVRLHYFPVSRVEHAVRAMPGTVRCLVEWDWEAV